MANKKGINKVAAGVVGAAVVAAAVGTAIVLSDKKNRKKLKNKFNEYKKEGGKAYAGLKREVEKEVKNARKNIKRKG